MGALPPTVRLVRFRSDGATHVHELLDCSRKEVQGRPRIEFAISVETSDRLKAVIEAVTQYYMFLPMSDNTDSIFQRLRVTRIVILKPPGQLFPPHFRHYAGGTGGE